MLTTSKTHQKIWPVTLSVCVTLILWHGSKWYYQDWFSDPFKVCQTREQASFDDDIRHEVSMSHP